MTFIVAAVSMGLWIIALIMITAVPIFFRHGALEWHRRARARHGRRAPRP
jgi:hypothetical protein